MAGSRRVTASTTMLAKYSLSPLTSLELSDVAAHLRSRPLRSSRSAPPISVDSSRTLATASVLAVRKLRWMACA